MEIVSDTAKTQSSMRTLPLVPVFREKLLELQAKQREYQKLCGNGYCADYLDYVYVNEIGKRISPETLTARFPEFLERNGLRRIRLHDLRHSCASLLLANGVPMKLIQDWLGHSDFATTANIYTHLDYGSKLVSAEAMMAGLGLTDGGSTGAI